MKTFYDHLIFCISKHIKLIIIILFFISCSDNSVYYENAYCLENISIIDLNYG